MKQNMKINFFIRNFLIAMTIVALNSCSGSGEEIEVYELLPGNIISTQPQKACLENPDDDIWFVHLKDDKDTSYPVYEDFNGKYRYYFVVKDNGQKYYFFNYYGKTPRYK